MRYLVPQFVDRSIKVVGPLDFKQFLFFLAGGGGCLASYIFFYHSHFMIFVLLCIISMSAGMSLAFVKYHGVPLPELIVNFFGYSFGGKKYIWEKKAIVDQPFQMPKMQEEVKEVKQAPMQRKSRLEDLSARVDVQR